MDIERIARTGHIQKTTTAKQMPSEKVTFTEIMQKQREERAYERFQQMIQKIDDQGKVLAESRTVEELRKYKELVKEFMDEAIEHGLRLEERRGFNRRGRTKIYKIVQEVDRKLLDLTDAVLEQQKKGLEILDMVGEIRGLLVNIYA